MADLIYVLNGPNLNLLGTREPELHCPGHADDIAGMLEDQARDLDIGTDLRQSNQ